MEGALLTSSPSAGRFDEEADAVRFDMFADGRGSVHSKQKEKNRAQDGEKSAFLYSRRPSMLLLLAAQKFCLPPTKSRALTVELHSLLPTGRRRRARRRTDGR